MRIGATPERPADAAPVESTGIGWVQQIDVDALLAAMPERSRLHLDVFVGAFVYEHQPLAWISPPPEDVSVLGEMRASIAIGDTRTMQEDVGFGIVQLVDVALRALSPGVNDPNTAADSVAHLGAVLLALWERDDVPDVVERDGRTVVRSELVHADYLEAVVGPLRVHGARDPQFAAAVVRTLGTVHREALRRSLAGPADLLLDRARSMVDACRHGDLAAADREVVERAFEEVVAGAARFRDTDTG